MKKKKFLKILEFKGENIENYFCLNHDLKIIQGRPQETTIFKSAMAPMKLSWDCYNKKKK
jgi:hypothetical protein